MKAKKSRNRRKVRQAIANPSELVPDSSPTASEVADLAADVWKFGERARTEGVGERVMMAFERAEDRLRRMGFEIETMTGKVYDTNLKARVMGHDPAVGPMIIAECISPAVFYRGKLVREAEVVTSGGEDQQ